MSRVQQKQARVAQRKTAEMVRNSKQQRQKRLETVNNRGSNKKTVEDSNACIDCFKKLSTIKEQKELQQEKKYINEGKEEKGKKSKEERKKEREP